MVPFLFAICSCNAPSPLPENKPLFPGSLPENKLFLDASLFLSQDDDNLCLGRPASLQSALCHFTRPQQDNLMVLKKSPSRHASLVL